MNAIVSTDAHTRTHTHMCMCKCWNTASDIRYFYEGGTFGLSYELIRLFHESICTKVGGTCTQVRVMRFLRGAHYVTAMVLLRAFASGLSSFDIKTMKWSRQVMHGVIWLPQCVAYPNTTVLWYIQKWPLHVSAMEHCGLLIAWCKCDCSACVVLECEPCCTL